MFNAFYIQWSRVIETFLIVKRLAIIPLQIIPEFTSFCMSDLKYFNIRNKRLNLFRRGTFDQPIVADKSSAKGLR